MPSIYSCGFDSKTSKNIVVGAIFGALLLVVFVNLPRQPETKILPPAPQIIYQTIKNPDNAVKVEVETNPVPTDEQLNTMSLADMSNFYHGYVESVQTLCSRVLRMGHIGDGGWNMCDDPKIRPDSKKCLVYSFGIANEWSYDDAMEAYGCEVHSYDPSMTKVADHVRGQRIHFHQVGISGQNIEKQPGKWALFTLGTIRKQNNHEPHQRRVDIVKLDVEGAEVPSLLKAIEEGSLKDVTQLSYEIHMYAGNSDPQRGVLVNHLKILRRLWDVGFRLYRTTLNSTPANGYKSKLHGVFRTMCTEVNFVNVKRA